VNSTIVLPSPVETPEGLSDRPELLQDFVELFLVRHGENFLVGNFTVMQLDSAISEAGDDGVVRNHYDGASLAMQLAQQAQDDFFIDCVQISSGFIGQNDLRIVDQGAGDANPLLFSAGELSGQVPGAVFQADMRQRLQGFLLVGHAVEVLGQHDIFERGEIGNQMELLKDEANFFRARPAQIQRGKLGHVFAVEPDLA
jgi:hypothetical protein